MAEARPSTRSADDAHDAASADARRELDEIREIVDELYALEGALQARVAPRLRAIKDGLAGVLEDAVQHHVEAPHEEPEYAESELSYLEPEEPARAEHPREPIGEAGLPPRTGGESAAAQAVLDELHAQRMEKWRAAINFVAECRAEQRHKFSELLAAIVQIRTEQRRRARRARR